MGFLDKANRTLAKAVVRHGDTMEKDADAPRGIPGQRTPTRRVEPLGEAGRRPRREHEARDDDVRRR